MKLSALPLLMALPASFAMGQISLVPVSSTATADIASIFDESAAEIVKFDASTQRIFIVNANADAIDVLDASDIENPLYLFSIDLTPWGSPNSLDLNPRPNRNEMAVAVENASGKTDNGFVVFFDLDGQFLGQADAGALPDMLTYDKTGKLVIVANEGEPNDDYSIDPEGSVTIIDVKHGPAKASAVQVSLSSLNDQTFPGVRISGPPGTSVAQDLEPEYIAIAPNNQLAYVACQENNAILVIDLKRKALSAILGLGYKDHSLPGNGLDPSNRDGQIAIRNWPVKGLFMPDSIEAYEADDAFYLVTANEGDSREYDTFVDEARIGDAGDPDEGIADLDAQAFPLKEMLKENANLGRLKFITTEGNLDEDPEYEEIYTFGARSFSIWTTDGALVFDSGDQFEQIVAWYDPNNFNSNNDENDSFDSRSDDKGPEPEGLVLGKIKGRTYAFIGLERVGGIMVYDITIPTAATFVTYVNNRDFSIPFDPDNLASISSVGDLGPEGLEFVPAHLSPSGFPLLIVGNEVSGTTTIYAVLTD